VLGEVPQQEMPTPAGQALAVHVVGGGRPRQRGREPPHGAERLEHLPVARRVGARPLDDVGAVRAALAGGARELPAPRDGLAEASPQGEGRVGGQFDPLVTEFDRDDTAVGAGVGGVDVVGGVDGVRRERVPRGLARPLVGVGDARCGWVTREFLDQQRGGCFPYPPWSLRLGSSRPHVGAASP
jgi:hypothetical protein